VPGTETSGPILDIAGEWLVLLLFVKEIPGLSLGADTVYPE